MNPAPIAIFAFNRPTHLQRALEALAANELARQSHITVFCDGPRDLVKFPEDMNKCKSVRKIARNTSGFASIEIVEREQNLGCANSVISGLTQMFARHERLIVIEDDILTSPYTLAFLNEGLERYANEHKVFNISAWTLPPHLLARPKDYAYDVYCVPRFNCWGWASWRDRFENLDWEVKNFAELQKNTERQQAYCAGGDDLYPLLDAQMQGKIDTWDIQADWWRFCHDQVGINPFFSYTTNIGFGDGTHTVCNRSYYDNNISLAIPPKKIKWIQQLHFDERVVLDYRLKITPHAERKNILQRLKIFLSVFIKSVKKFFNIDDFSPHFINAFFNIFWIDRRALYNAIKDNIDNLHGNVLDFGSGTSPYLHLMPKGVEYHAMEFDTPKNRSMKNADLFYDGVKIPLEDKSIDCILSTQCLEHIYNPEQIIREWSRILSEDGKILLTVPLLWPEHEMPHDYQRYTTNGIKLLLEQNNFKVIKIVRLAQGCRAPTQILLAWIYDVFLSKCPRLIQLLFCCFFVSPFAICASLLDILFKANTNTYLSQLVLAVKQKTNCQD